MECCLLKLIHLEPVVDLLKEGVVGVVPTDTVFFKQLLLIFLIQQMASGLLRVIARVCRTMTMANTGGVLALLLILLLGGFTVPNEILNWLIWGYWVSPLTYGFNAIAVNERLAPRADNTTRLGISVLNNFDVFPEKKWYWIGVAALLGFSVLFNVLILIVLMFFDPLGKKQTSLSEEEAQEMDAGQDETKEPRLRRPKSQRDSVPQSLSAADGNNSSQ